MKIRIFYGLKCSVYHYIVCWHNIVACRVVSRQRLGKHVPAETDTHATIEVLLETMFSTWSVQRSYNEDNWTKKRQTRVEAGSNTSTVILRVVGGDEKGSLKSETVKYGRKSQGTRTRERMHWQGPAAHTKDRPVLSWERATHGIKNVTVRRIPYSERKKNLVVNPGWVLYTKTDWPTYRRS
jgi:hypothetical protein